MLPTAGALPVVELALLPGPRQLGRLVDQLEELRAVAAGVRALAGLGPRTRAIERRRPTVLRVPQEHAEGGDRGREPEVGRGPIERAHPGVIIVMKDDRPEEVW